MPDASGAGLHIIARRKPGSQQWWIDEDNASWPTPGQTFCRARGQTNVLGRALLAALLLAGCASLPPAAEGEHLARIGLLALLQTFNADLLSHDSATLTLERWCADHRLADPAKILARRDQGVIKPIPDDVRAGLSVGANESIGYRHVQLACGSHVLSEADNWYVPNRLTAEMNRQLDATDEPFGKVVKPLGFQRRTLATQLLWSPLPPGWEMSKAPMPSGPAATLRIPRHVLRHDAILYSAAGIPFSAVVETYTNQLFEFDGWARYVGD